MKKQNTKSLLKVQQEEQKVVDDDNNNFDNVPLAKHERIGSRQDRREGAT